jgi:hypothetical protein
MFVRDINDWLATPTDQLGAGVRAYPSRPRTAGATEPPYTWSTLFRLAGPRQVEFVVFVNRRSMRTPFFGRGTDGPQDYYGIQLPVTVQDPISGESGEQHGPEAFQQGGFIVHPDGTVRQITFVDLSRNQLRFTDPFPEVPAPLPLWFIPADSATGRSPVIAVFKRTFPL